jgi:hypothetical protein
VEAFDLAVGLGPVGTGALVGDAEFGARVGPVVGAVRATVVGQDPAHAHPTIGEPRDGVAQHGRGGLLGLVVMGFHVGHAGVVVEDGVQVAGPDQWLPVLALRGAGAGRGRGPVLLALLAADVAPAAAVGDLAELLDVNVDQVAGVFVLVPADPLTGYPVDVAEPVEAAPGQHRVDRRCRHPERVGDLDRTQPAPQAQPHDLAHHLRWGAMGLPEGCTRAVHHPGGPLVAVPGGPLRRGLPRHVVPLGRPGRRPPVVDDQPRQP